MIEAAHNGQPIEAEMPVDPNHIGIAQWQIGRRSDITQTRETDPEHDPHEYRLDETLKANGARKYGPGVETEQQRGAGPQWHAVKKGRADIEESTAADRQRVNRDRHDHRGTQFDRS